MKLKKLSSWDIAPYQYERRDIYVITYLPTGKKYVGKSRDVKKRFDCHYYSLRGHRHSVEELQHDYDKYGGGRESFKVEIIDYQFPYFSDKYDQEHSAMMQLKTYDSKYGYNTHDPMIQWIREKDGLPVVLFGWQKRRAIASNKGGEK